jgi:hypothetical protein
LLVMSFQSFLLPLDFLSKIDLTPQSIAGPTTIAMKGNRYEYWYCEVV